MGAFRELDLDGKAARLNEAGGRLTYRFRARDVHLVMGPADPGGPVRFRVQIDETRREPRAGSTSVIAQGTASDRRLYQLVRQPGAVGEHTFEITFLEPGVEAYVFTFG
jgi:hypothetical protein